jgi:hypothetical protein
MAWVFLPIYILGKGDKYTFLNNGLKLMKICSLLFSEIWSGPMVGTTDVIDGAGTFNIGWRGVLEVGPLEVVFPEFI